MNIVCLDLEGVLVPEMWIAFAEATGIPEFRRTTRDEPNFDRLMHFRIDLLKKHRLEEMRRTYERIERQRQSVEDRAARIGDMLKGRKSMMFSEMIEDDRSAYGRVITFMALLDMLRDGLIDAEQKKRYADIKVTPLKL